MLKKKLTTLLVAATTYITAAQSPPTTFELDLTDPVKPELPKRQLQVELSFDKNGFPHQYKMPLMVDVCLDGLCKLLRVTLYWDAIGNYSHLKYPEGFPLSKGDHVEFTPQDYYRLDDLLKNKYSILRTHPLSYFIGSKKKKSIEGVDAISAATPIAARAAVVHGAAYTSWALWRWANGKIVKSLIAKTDSLASADYIVHCLTSQKPYFIRYALNFVSTSKLSDQRLELAYFNVFKHSSTSDCETALEFLKASTISKETLVERLIQCYGENTGSFRLILNYVAEEAANDNRVWELLAARLKNTPNRVATTMALALLKKHAADNESVKGEIRLLTKSKNNIIALRASNFLN